MSTASLLGKQELLQWACQQSGVPQCMRYDDLKDGFVLLCLAEKLWPGLVDANIIRNQRRGQRTSRTNWELLRSVMTAVGLPVHLCDPKGVAAGHQRPCYNLLVMFYFLSKLAISSDFSVDFAHPIDEALAAFLQSPDSIQALSKGQTKGGEESSLPTPSNSKAATGNRAVRPTEVPREYNEYAVERSLSPAHPAPSPHRRPPTATPQGGGAARHGMDEHHETFLPATPRQSANASIYAQRELQHCRRAKELLEQELAHVRLMSRHTLEQQRSLVEAEMARTAAQYASQNVTTRMEAEFEAQKAALSVRAELDRVLEDIQLERQSIQGLQGPERLEQEVLTLRQTNAVLMGKLQAMDNAVERSVREASQWKEALEVSRGQFDRVLATLQASAIQCKESIEADGETLPMLLVERLSAAEKSQVLRIVRQQQEEKKELRLRADRLEEQLKESQFRHTSTSYSASNGPVQPNHNASTGDALQLQRLQRANALLHEELGLLRRSGMSANGGPVDIREMQQLLQTPDTCAEHLPDGTGAIPSTSLGPSATAVDALCASVWERLKKATATHADAASVETIQSLFWALTATSQVLNARLRNCGRTVHELSNALSAVQRDRIIERHRAAKDTREKTESLRSQLQQQTAAARQATGDTELELKLCRDEAQQLRKDVPHAFERFRKMLGDLFSEFENELDGPREQSKILSRLNAQLRNREHQWRQVAELLLDAARRGNHGTPAVAQAQEVVERLTREPELSARDAQQRVDGKESTDSVRHALEQIRISVDEAVRTVFGRLEQSQHITEELRRVSHELAACKADAELQRTICDASRRECELLRADVDRMDETAAKLQSSEDVLRQRLAAQIREEQLNMEETTGRILSSIGVEQPAIPRSRPQAHNVLPQEVEGKRSTQVAGATEPPPSVREWISTVGSMVAPAAAGMSTTHQSSSASLQQLATAHEMTYVTSHRNDIVVTPSAHSETSAQAPSHRTPSVLTPDELERRKQEILQKYGVRSSRSSTA